MTRLLLKALVYGFITGAVLLVLAPLGLTIAFVEFLKPVLAPGVSLLHMVSGNVVGIAFWMLAVVLNGLVYAAFTFGLLFVCQRVSNRKARVVTMMQVILTFLAFTGMLGQLYRFIISPAKSANPAMQPSTSTPELRINR